MIPDLLCAWAVLLYCASARANYVIRVVRPEQSQRFARCHDEGLWSCMCNLLELPRDCAPLVIKDNCTLPLVLGLLGLRSFTRTRESAFWASWADAHHMIHQRHPTIAVEVVDGLVRAGGCAWVPGNHHTRSTSMSPEEHKDGNTCLPRGWRSTIGTATFFPL